jgi:hypothetical protein
MYARGILFGKMVQELGDTCIAKNEKHGLFCDLEFKTKVSVTILFTWGWLHLTILSGIFLGHLQRHRGPGAQ